MQRRYTFFNCNFPPVQCRSYLRRSCNITFMLLHRSLACVNSKCLILASTSILITRFGNDLLHTQTQMALAVGDINVSVAFKQFMQARLRLSFGFFFVQFFSLLGSLSMVWLDGESFHKTFKVTILFSIEVFHVKSHFYY